MKKAAILLLLGGLVIGLPVINKTFVSGEAKDVFVEEVQKRTIKSSILASGHIAFAEEVLLTSEVVGKVTKVWVEEGEVVEKGQPLLQLDEQALASAVSQNAAAVRIKRIEIERQQARIAERASIWERHKSLFDRRLIDQATFSASTHELELARIDLALSQESLAQTEAQLLQAETNLEKATLFSPISGVVTVVDIKEGETAITGTTNIPGSTLMSIVNMDRVHAVINVDETDVANIEVGQEASVVAIAYSDQPIRGVVENVGIAARKAEGRQGFSFEVKVRLDEPGQLHLRPGMSSRAEIYTVNRNEVSAVPSQAVLVDESATQKNYYVLVARDNKVQKVAVELGISDDQYQEIQQQELDGATIITGPRDTLRYLNQGESVSVKRS